MHKGYNSIWVRVESTLSVVICSSGKLKEINEHKIINGIWYMIIFPLYILFSASVSTLIKSKTDQYSQGLKCSVSLVWMSVTVILFYHAVDVQTLSISCKWTINQQFQYCIVLFTHYVNIIYQQQSIINQL